MWWVILKIYKWRVKLGRALVSIKNEVGGWGHRTDTVIYEEFLSEYFKMNFKIRLLQLQITELQMNIIWNQEKYRK